MVPTEGYHPNQLAEAASTPNMLSQHLPFSGCMKFRRIH
jgi:hypothetical protein